MKPLGSQILIELEPIPKEEEVKSDGGIILAIGKKAEDEMAKLAMTQDIGTVVDIGAKAFLGIFEDGETPDVKVGDKVVFARYGGTRYNYKDGRRFAAIVYRELKTKVDQLDEEGLIK